MEATVDDVLLERDRELARLDAVVAEACEGRGRLLLVEGPAGIGKTKLLDALRARARERGMPVLSARASELDREFPFGVVRQLFEPLLAAAEVPRRSRLLQGPAGLTATLLGAGSPAAAADAPGGTGLDPALARFHALYWLTANLADEGPLALLIDDVHWADATSLRFLGFLLARLGELPVVVALAARPPERDARRELLDALATDALALVVRPAPLSEAAVASLVATELGDVPGHGFADACREVTGGNPFLLRELLRELVAEGITPSAERVGVVRQLAPPTVARAVLLRLARLGGEACALAQAVAVLGDEAPLHRAAALAAIPAGRADEVAGSLAHAEILAPARPLSFVHPIVRAAAYGDIDPGERDRAHRRAADLLTAEGAAVDAVAAHLLATEPRNDPSVAETLRAAARDAFARGAASAECAYLRRALSEPPPADERPQVVFELGSAELHVGEPAAAIRHFEEGMRVTSEPRSRFVCWWEHSIALQAVGRADEAFALRERAVEEVADADPELALEVESSLIASACVDLSRLDWARERLERQRSRPSPETAAGWRLVATRAWVEAFYGDAPAATVADAAQRALAVRRQVREKGEMSPTPFFMAVEVLSLADRVDAARGALDDAIDDARREGSAPGFACAAGWRCLVYARAGELADAEADARRCAELSLPTGWFRLAPPMLGYVLGVLIDRSELDAAQELLDETGMTNADAGDDLTRFPILHARARLRAARGDVAGGREDLAAISRTGGRWNTYPTLAPPVLVAPELAGEADVDVARMTADANSWGTPRAIGMALRTAGLVEGGERGIELLEEAAAALEGSPARVEHAAALADLGAALRRANRRTAAREPLRRALDIADECGAPALAARASHELRAAGGRPRRPRVSGAGALTPSEQRIARMAAEGMSNPEIAQALFVTKKTVEAHLGNAYRKLGIRSRTALPAALRRAGS